MFRILPIQPTINPISVWLVGLVMSFMAQAGLVAADDADVVSSPPHRVKDLAYGEILYAFHQNHLFDALVKTAVAEARGGVQHHGDYPFILKGGMYLAYGITEQAKQIFLEALQQNLNPAVKNRAWFYLGKVYYLQRNWTDLEKSLTRIDAPLLADSHPLEFAELRYLQVQSYIAQNQLALANQLLSQISESNPWKPYVQHNLALALLRQDQRDPAIALLKQASTSIQEITDEQTFPVDQDEIDGIRDRIAMSLAMLQLDAGNTRAAMDAYRQVRLHGPWSERALFGYAMAAASNQNFGLALEALSSLGKRNPQNLLVQESQYAQAYIYEQLEKPGLALTGYRKAVNQYQDLLQQNQQQQSNLASNSLEEILLFSAADGEQWRLTDERFPIDRFGRLLIVPEQSAYVDLLADEHFQSRLKEYRELHLLRQNLLNAKADVESFKLMLATRNNLREQRVQEVQQQLEVTDVESLFVQRDRLNVKIQQGLDANDHLAFADAADIEFYNLIESVKNRLAALPNDYRDPEFAGKIRRIEGYFTWQLAEKAPIQRWQAQVELKQLDAALTGLRIQRQRLDKLLADRSTIRRLADRIDQTGQRVPALLTKVERLLADKERELLGLVQAQLASQEQAIRGYLQAARLSQARLADALLEKQLAGTKNPSELSGEDLVSTGKVEL